MPDPILEFGPYRFKLSTDVTPNGDGTLPIGGGSGGTAFPDTARLTVRAGALANGANALQFDGATGTTLWRPDGWYDAADPTKLTPTRTGRYLVVATIYWPAYSNIAVLASARISLNGTTVFLAINDEPSDATSAHRTQVVGIVPINTVGDYIGLVATVNSSSGASTISGSDMFITVARVGD